MHNQAVHTLRTITRPLRRVETRLGTGGVAAAAVGILLLQQLTVRLVEPSGAALLPRTAIIYVTTAALVVLVLHFRRLAGCWLVSLGVACNLLAMTANSGSMPIAFEDLAGHSIGRLAPVTENQIGDQLPQSKDILLRRADVNLAFFSDHHLVDLPVYGENIYSIGDFVLFGGLVLAAGQAAIGPFLPRRTMDKPAAQAVKL